MNVFEKKADICLRWILAENEDQRNKIAQQAVSLLQMNEEKTRYFAVGDCVEDLLKELGAGQALSGFNYLVCAIMLVMNDAGYISRMTTALYPDVAKKFNTTASRVERAVRHVIERAFDCGDIDALVKLFGNGVSRFKGKTTNSEFIAGCAREAKRRIRNSAGQGGDKHAKL